jgi:hypothetical protein
VLGAWCLVLGAWCLVLGSLKEGVPQKEPDDLISNTKELGKFRLESINSSAGFIRGKGYYYNPQSEKNYVYKIRGIPKPYWIHEKRLKRTTTQIRRRSVGEDLLSFQKKKDMKVSKQTSLKGESVFFSFYLLR